MDSNTSKTKEPIINFRRSKHTEHTDLYLRGEEVERVESSKFRHVHILVDLAWTT